MKKTLTKLTFALALTSAAVSFGISPAQALVFCRPGGGIYCPDVWDPVICSNGVVYSNSCYASVACATGCVPYRDAI